MAHTDGPRPSGDAGNGTERYEVLTRSGDIQGIQGARICLVLRSQLHHDPVLVRRAVDRTHLLAPVSLRERRLHLLGGDTESGGRLATEVDLELRIVER